MFACAEFRADQDVVITVVNLFPETTKENEKSVSDTIDKAIKSNSIGITKYDMEDRCDVNGTSFSSEITQSNNGSFTTVSSETTQSNDESFTTVSSETTQSNDGLSSITVTKSDSPSTVSSVTFSSDISSKTSNPNPDDTTGVCQEDSCSGVASCVNLNNTHVCLCIDGYYYNSSKCNKGKVFPGTITVKVPEISGLQDGHSVAYEKLYLEVLKFFEDAFDLSLIHI